MLAWMLYVVMVTALLSIGAFIAERAARIGRGRTRWIWLTAIIASLLVPTVIASVTLQLPSVMTPSVAEKIVVLRETTTQALSPVMWISGSAAEPPAWRDFDSLLTTLWRAASAAMLLGLIVSGIVLFARKRRWRLDQVSGAQVYVTEGVGPAVVGLLRPRIVVPRWVTMALPRHQAAVIAHEQSHLQARDPQLFTLALALLVFMPWNLPLWWQLRRLRYAIEVDCDARVLEGGIDPTHYGETLISVGERQSAYIGAVAAMSESKSFLEERIRIMISKPVKWRRVGVAALAGVALTLTALAAQVSPPNTHTVTADTAEKSGGGHKPPSERVAIELPAASLDRHVGTWKMDERAYFSVKRDGEKLMVRITGQPETQVFAEREGYFFWKIVDAQIEFNEDGQTAVLHQYGKDFPLTRADASEAVLAQTALDARIASQAPQPGSEAALRKQLASMENGKFDYSIMEPLLVEATSKQEDMMRFMMTQLGAVKTVTFKSVGQQGWDTYEVQHANGKMNYILTMADNGKIAGFMTMQTP